MSLAGKGARIKRAETQCDEPAGTKPFRTHSRALLPVLLHHAHLTHMINILYYYCSRRITILFLGSVSVLL